MAALRGNPPACHRARDHWVAWSQGQSRHCTSRSWVPRLYYRTIVLSKLMSIFAQAAMEKGNVSAGLMRCGVSGGRRGAHRGGSLDEDPYPWRFRRRRCAPAFGCPDSECSRRRSYRCHGGTPIPGRVVITASRRCSAARSIFPAERLGHFPQVWRQALVPARAAQEPRKAYRDRKSMPIPRFTREPGVRVTRLPDLAVFGCRCVHM